MSEFDPTSFQPPYPPSPMAVVPVPFESPYPPDYGYAGRPGLVTTIGVFCIVVAGISIIFGGFLGLINFSIANSSRTKAARTGLPAVVVPTKTGQPAELVSTGGMNAVDRQAVIDGLNSIRPLTVAQGRQLDELLAVDGANLFPPDPATPVNADGIKAVVSGSGPLRNDAEGGDSFTIADGRVEVSDSRATFQPTDMSGARVVVNAISIPPVAEGAAQPALNDDQIRSILREISHRAGDSKSGEHLSAAQGKSLIELLRRSGQLFVTPTNDGSDPAYEVDAVTVMEDESMQIVSTAGPNTSTILLSHDGTVVRAGTVPTIPPINFNPRIDRTAGVLTGTLTVANLLLAVYLLVVGIFIFRQSFKARWMAWIFVVVKLPVTLGCGFAAIWMWNGLIASSAGTPQFLTDALEIDRNIFATPPFVGAIFPPILALLLIMPSVRKYYSGKVGA